jgi:CMP-N-acetylneuraminic acid synthetase
MEEHILITICARGGSKGIPGKNTKLLNGKPLIEYTLQVADAFRFVYSNTVIVLSTDSQYIKSVVRNSSIKNIETDYERPELLATDNAGKLDTIIHVKEYVEQTFNVNFDYLLDLDVTSPLRTVEDLHEALNILKTNSEALNIFSVSPANRNPYFNMVEEAENGFYKLCKEGLFLTRQSAPKVYDLNASFYIYSALFFQQSVKKVINDKTLVYPVEHLCFDLDHPIDFEFLSFLLEKNKLDFKF